MSGARPAGAERWAGSARDASGSAAKGEGLVETAPVAARAASRLRASRYPSVDASELMAWVKERKGSALTPKTVEFSEAIPFTAVGKPRQAGVACPVPGRPRSCRQLITNRRNNGEQPTSPSSSMGRAATPVAPSPNTAGHTLPFLGATGDALG